MTSADVTLTFHIPDVDNMLGTVPELVEALTATAAKFNAAPATRTPATATYPTMGGVHLTAADMDALPAGSRLRDSMGVVMAKDAGGRWSDDTGSTTVAESVAFAEFWHPVLVSVPNTTITNTKE